MGRFSGIRTPLVVDDFARADGAIGGLWTADPDAGVNPVFEIASGKIVGAASNPWMFYDLELGPTCQAGAKVPDYPGGTFEVELIVGAGLGTWGGYAIGFDGTDFLLTRYGRSDVGPDSTLDTVAGSFSGGDGLMLRLIGGRVEGWHIPSGGAPELVAWKVDSDPFGPPFKPGLFCGNATLTFDDFSAGPLFGGITDQLGRR